MAALSRALALLALVHPVESAKCSSEAVAWGVSQLLGQGCAADTAFFDGKKADTEIASPGDAAAIKAACCTPFADAKCSDWALVKGSCGAGTTFQAGNSAPADSTDGKDLSVSKYKELCCTYVAEKCSSKALAWATSQLLGQGCAADTKFFDGKKADTEIASPGDAAAIKAACCTPFADAKCSDWQAVKGSCGAGTTFQAGNSAPASSSNGKDISVSKYKELCCTYVAEKCSSKSIAWAASQLLGAGCAADTKFFDGKKADTEIASPGDAAAIKAACCTPFADAKCSDWALVKGSCDTDKIFASGNSAPADSTDGKDLSVAKYKELCCVEEGTEVNDAPRLVGTAVYICLAVYMLTLL